MRYTIGIAEEDGGRIHKADNLVGIIELLANHIYYTTGDEVIIPELANKYGKKKYNNEWIDDVRESLE